MKIKLIVIVVLILAAAVGFFVITGGEVSRQQEYQETLSTAQSYAEREIPYMAVQWYLRAIAMKNEDEKIYSEYLQEASELGNPYYKDALEGYPVSFPTSSRAYELLCEYQYETGDYVRAIQTAAAAGQQHVATDRVQEIYYTCFYSYRYIRAGLQEADRFLGSLARVKLQDGYGIIDSNGHFLFGSDFVDVAPMVGSTVAVRDETEWYMMNSAGYKIARTSEPVDRLSYLSDGWVLFEKNGKYGYMNSSLTVPENLPFDGASNFRDGIAAVKKDGKWGLINSNGEQITEYVFDDILLDDFDTCISNGVVFAKQSGKYYMYRSDGTQISDRGFDDAYPFIGNGTGAAAVCINGKWGFVNETGETVIEPAYEGARSFCLDLAPVCSNAVWGYINSKGVYRIEPAFEDAMPFSQNGAAAVKENEVWSYIRLQAFTDD